MWPIAIAVIFNVIYLKGDTIILSIFRDQGEVGVYGAAYRVIDILAQIAMMIMGVMLPILSFHWAKNNKKQFQHFYQQSIDIMLLLAVPLVVGGMVLATPIMTLVAGENFAGSGPILAILLIGIFALYLGGIYGHVSVAIEKQKQTLWIFMSNAVITLIGYMIFIPLYGMWGAAWMTVFSELYAGFFLMIVVHRYTGMKVELQTFAKIVFAAIVMGAVLYIFNTLHVLLLLPLGLVVYGVFLFGLGAVSKETLKEIFTLKA